MRLHPTFAVAIALSPWFIVGFASASQISDWMEQLDNPDYEINRLQATNLVDKYSKFDFSKLLIPHTELLGYVGKNYQRLYIDLDSISRDPNDSKRYLVHGKSKVQSDARPFGGDIVVTMIREYVAMHYGLDAEMKSAGIRSEGLLVGRYKFRQRDNQTPGGTFEGIVTLYWYVDKNGRIRYDDIEKNVADGYRNNQYVGTWTAANSKLPEVANWGEFRIPFSGDLDIGAADFSANPKYGDEGW